MKNINKFACLAGAAAILSMGLVACDDQDDEITSLEFSRIFAPTGLSVKVRNNTNIQLQWDKVAAATAYQVAYCAAEDSLDETKYEVLKSDIDKDATTYTFEGFAGETSYYLAIKALAEDASRNSKYVGGSVTTEGEDITKTVNEETITSSSAVIEWDDARGAGVTYIQILKDSEVVEELTHTVTAEEQEAMAATVTGLAEQTTYKARLVLEENGTVTYRGTTASFKTARDISSFTGGVVSTAENLATAIENAEEGAVIGLDEGAVITIEGATEGTVGSLTISKSLTITSYSTTNPGTLNTRLDIQDGAAVTVSNVILDGTGTDGGQAFNYSTASASYGALVVENCEISTYTKGVFYLNVASTVESVTFNNCTIHDVTCSGGDLFDSRAGAFNSFTLTNCTLYNSAISRDFFRMDDASSSFPDYAPVFTVENNIFYNCGSGGANYRIFYIRFAGNSISFKNNIVEGFANTRGFANNSATAVPDFKNNFYYNCINLQSLADGNTQTGLDNYFDADGTTLTASPFQDPENGDFTITNIDVTDAKAGPQAE